MNKKAVAWFYQQLPELIAKGVITEESAKQIKEYYGPVTDNTGTRTFLLVFSVIGALLVGLGIILILAHNWEQLTKLYRLVISVGLLVVAQIIAGCVLWFKRESIIWREASATLLMLMVGAALAMVGQTYHLVDDVDAFLLTWMVLSLPLVYLMKSTAIATLYIIGVTSWTSNQYGLSKQFIWLLFAFVLPYYKELLTNRRTSNATVIFSWVVTICFYFVFGAAFSSYYDELGMLIYSALFALTYLIGVVWFSQGEPGGRMPFKALGLAGSIAITFILTFNDVWRHLALDWNSVPTIVYVLVAVLLVLVVSGDLFLRNQGVQSVRRFLVIPCIIGVAYLILLYDPSGSSSAIMLNAYMLYLSVSIMASGVRDQRLGIVNTGMLMIVALIIARFFDIDVSFVVRGIVFVLVGLAFFTANIILLRRKTGVQHEK